MSKKKIDNKENENVLNELRQKVYDIYGKYEIKSSDCVILAELIGDKRMYQTLRRFFGVIKSETNTSEYYLDLICGYCGFKNFQEFKTFYTNESLVSFFGKDDSDENYCSKAEELCKNVMASPKLLITIHHQLMEFPMVRKFFLEHYPIRDMLGTVYSQYFLAYLKYNTSNEAKIFAYGFLFKGAFLQENDELIHLYFSKLNEVPFTTDIFVVPAGLRFGVQLLYADYIKHDAYFDDVFLEMKKYREKYIPKSQESACSFEYSVLELLIFTNRKEEMRFLVENQTIQIKKDRSFVSEERTQTHREVWKILCAVSYHKIGDKTKCLEYLSDINLNRVGVGWNKYYTILYHFVCLQNPEFSVKVDSHNILENLINETYFYYYKTALQDVFKNDLTRNIIKKIY